MNRSSSTPPLLVAQHGVLRAALGDLRRRRWRAAAAAAPRRPGPDVSTSPMWLTSKMPGALAHRHVLLADAGVLHRHLPARERHELRAGGDVAVVQRRALECVRPCGHGASGPYHRGRTATRVRSPVLRVVGRGSTSCGERTMAGMRIVVGAGLAAALVALLAPAGARAGTYDVVSCNAPGANGRNNSLEYAPRASTRSTRARSAAGTRPTRPAPTVWSRARAPWTERSRSG